MCGVYQTQGGKYFVLPSVKLVSINASNCLGNNRLFFYRHESNCSTTPVGSMNIRHLTSVKPSSVKRALVYFLESEAVFWRKTGRRSICTRKSCAKHPASLERLSSMQALGASGACHMGAKFLKIHYGPYKSNPERRVYIPRETWGKYLGDPTIPAISHSLIVIHRQSIIQMFSTMCNSRLPSCLTIILTPTDLTSSNSTTH
jgi:hypothetical protein